MSTISKGFATSALERRGFHNRGSVLIVALLFAAAIAISLGSFIRLATQASQLSYRTLYAGTAMNFAELGLEQGMWSVNKKLAGNASAWTDWDTSSGSSARRTFDLGKIEGGATGVVKVYVSDRNVTNNPFILARSIITPPSGGAIEKWVKVSLLKRSRFASGLVSKNTITFNGNASVDSWNSDPDNNDATATIPYSSAVRNDRGSIGSVSVANTAVSVNNGDVWGYASTGGADPTDEVGNNGSILGKDSAAKDKSDWEKSSVDPDRIATDFTATFEEVQAPTGGTAWSSGSSIGATGTTKTYTYSGKISNDLTVKGNVTLILTGTGEVIKITGNSSINLEDNASLTIYTAGDIKIAGNGIVNPHNPPKSVQIYGTASDSDSNPGTTHQSMDITGNGDTKLVLYAPNADVKVAGNGSVQGAIVAGNVTIGGNGEFHYDEALANLDTSEPLGIDEWTEYVSYVDRNANSSLMNF